MPGARTLLLIVLATLLTALAGPSAAVYAAPTDADRASVTGIAPNGDDATVRADQPVPSVLPGEQVALGVPVGGHAGVQAPLQVILATTSSSHRDRAPPAG
ncbi:MAG: hypothetical protein ACRDRV_08525 [Pseudonocardiaceae bacterium]